MKLWKVTAFLLLGLLSVVAVLHVIDSAGEMFRNSVSQSRELS